MADEVLLGAGVGRAKIRNPWFVGVVVFVTLGIYGFFWWYFVNREMADFGRSRNTSELGDSPGRSVLAITLGVLVIVPAVLSTINTFRRVQRAQRLVGLTPINGWIGLVLVLVVSPAFYAYMQRGLNSVWQTLQAESLEELPTTATPA